MALRYDGLQDLPPGIRAQAEAKMAKRGPGCPRKRTAQPGTTLGSILDQMDSKAEKDFYLEQVWPKLQSGQIETCELHRAFELLPKSEYCGIQLPAAKYTVDFFITYANGHMEAVEVKHKVIRKLQRDYIYRRRLFIEVHARPNGWGFREIITGGEK